ncbi:MAG: sugar ABC transporter ATP-binding protein [Spirochaetales bacterium]|uniref:Sugar ABC transporter ATP-binding protein n=1 Tax=Candidatus Thalassospirochaeta sargassi TaxID=3119039 RepID=A0AAJ1MNG5_9SPIO|nr:sugar ABC transporter ATP-binding protein [Spirochaetales bacterium]
MSEKLLEAKGVSKTFPGVRALSNVDFALGRGEIHGLMGENGAGKSTLIKAITGVFPRDEGDIFLDGEVIHPHSPMDAEALGISTVYQEVNLLPNLSVAENLIIGRQPMKRGCIDWKTINNDAIKILQKFDINIDVTELLGSYSIAIQQMVAIARALELDSKLLILDEPTSSLNLDEVQKLFIQMRRLKEEGQSIIFVTHFLDQVFEITDKITVLRNGEYVGEYNTADLTKLDLISKLMGKALDELKEFEHIAENKVDEDAEALLCTDGSGKAGYLNPFNIYINKGDVVGLAGLLGSGRSEIANMLFGIVKPDKGSMSIRNKKIKISSPAQALKNHIALCPEDRKNEGIIAGLSVKENIVLALQVKQGWLKNINTRKQNELARKYIDMLDIKTPSVDQAIENLSGGNQQKVIVARWLATNPELLIVDEPTRGIDVGAKTEIQKLIVQLAQDGMGVLFISSEIEEVVRCSNRVYVLQERSVVGELAGSDIDEHKIMHTIAGKGE